MQIDCSTASTLYASVAGNKSQFIYDTLPYYVDGPSTVKIDCSGLHDLVMLPGDSFLLSPSVYGSMADLQAAIEATGITTDSLLFFLGVITAGAFILGLRMRL